MRKRLAMMFVTALALLMIVTTLVPAGAMAGTKKPADTVKGFIGEVVKLNADKAAQYWVEAERANVTSNIKNVPSDVKVSVSTLKISGCIPIADTDVVSAIYNIKIKSQGKADVHKNNEQAGFTLERVGKDWLISKSSIWNNEPWMQPTALPPVATTPAARYRHAMARLNDDKVLMFGGTTDDTDALNDLWEYNSSSHTWTEIEVNGDVPEGRVEHVMAYAGGKKIVMFGGASQICQTPFNGTWEYDVSTKKWTKYSKSGPPASRASFMAYGGGNKLVFFGGICDSCGGVFPGTWEYNFVTHKWIRPNISGAKPDGRCCGAMAYAGGTKVILFGGDTGSPSGTISFGSTWEYDTETQKWTEYNTTGIKPDERIHFIMSYAGGSKIVLHGGFKGSRENPELLNDTWEYDADTHTWTETGINPGPSGAAEYIGNNKIVAYGTQGIWEYDISTHKWTHISISMSGVHTGLDINSTIGQLLDNPYTKAVIDNCIPGLSTSPQVDSVRGMTLPKVQELSSGAITQTMIDCVTAGLLAIK